ISNEREKIQTITARAQNVFICLLPSMLFETNRGFQKRYLVNVPTSLVSALTGDHEKRLLSEGLTGLAREAEVEDPLGRHRLCKFNTLSGHRDHLPLQF